MNSLSISYENVWRILEEYEFNIDLQLYKDLVCNICKKLLKNAYQAPCGCRYCHTCIVNYLNEENRYCTGDGVYCKENIIDIAQDMHIDNAANRSISNLVVKCPEEFCLFSSELKSIENHIKSHQMKCPYFDIGCSNPRIGQEKMNEHLQTDNYSHSILLMDSIQNSKNEMSFLKEDTQTKDLLMMELQKKIDLIEEKISMEDYHVNLMNRMEKIGKDNIKLKRDNEWAKEEINQLKLQMQTKQTKICQMEIQMDEVHISHTLQLRNLEESQLANKNLLNTIEIKLDSFNMDLLSIRENIESYQDRFERVETEIVQVNIADRYTVDELNQLKNEFAEMQNERKQISSEILLIEEKYQQEKDLVIDLKQALDEISFDKKQINEEIEKITLKRSEIQADPVVQNENLSIGFVDSLVPVDNNDNPLNIVESTNVNIAPFLWKLEQFSEKRQKARAGIISFINSNPFYSHENGYKLCLSVFPDGCGSGKRSYLTIGCRLMKGEHDDQLSWPMKHSINISLIDQKFNVVYITHRFQYNSIPQKNRIRFNQPKQAMNEGVGATRFISLNKLLNDSRLFRDDSLLFRCVVNV